MATVHEKSFGTEIVENPEGNHAKSDQKRRDDVRDKSHSRGIC